MKPVRDTFHLDWKRPVEDGGLPIFGYVVERKTEQRPQWTKVLIK